MSKVAEYSRFLQGAHTMAGADGLTDYHAARNMVNAGRAKDVVTRIYRVRRSVASYRVMVNIQDEHVRVFRPDTHTEVLL